MSAAFSKYDEVYMSSSSENLADLTLKLLKPNINISQWVFQAVYRVIQFQLLELSLHDSDIFVIY